MGCAESWDVWAQATPNVFGLDGIFDVDDAVHNSYFSSFVTKSRRL